LQIYTGGAGEGGGFLKANANQVFEAHWLLKQNEPIIGALLRIMWLQAGWVKDSI